MFCRENISLFLNLTFGDTDTRDTGGYSGIQGDTWDTGGYMGIQGDTGGYSIQEMQGDTGGYRGIHGDTGGYRGIQGDTGGYI